LLKPGHKIRVRNGAEAAVLSETEDGEWVKVRYLVDEVSSLTRAEDLVNESDVEALLDVTRNKTWGDKVTVVLHCIPESEEYEGGYETETMTVSCRLRGERDPATGDLGILTGSTAYSPEEFWKEAVGIVTPHRAQQGLIVSRLQQVFAGTGVPPNLIRSAVDTVERFQGQERDVIIASYALGDPDAIADEDEFLMSLNRFNVMASRPRAKLIVLVSREIVDHLSGDLDTLRGSRLLKVFADSFCSNSRATTLGLLEDGQYKEVSGSLRWREQ
jgi:hypothetical protein